MKKKEIQREEQLKQDGKLAAESGKSKDDCPHMSIMDRAAWLWGFMFLADSAFKVEDIE